MIDRKTKIAIIGAGMCGSFLSYLLARKGFSAISLFEKKSFHSSNQLGKVCGGCLHHSAVSIFKENGLESIIQPGIDIKKVSLISPEKNTSFSLQHGKWINRRTVDDLLLERAQQEGVSVFNSKAKILDSENGIIQYGGKQENFEFIVDCGGISGSALPHWDETNISPAGFGFHGYCNADENRNHHLQSIEVGEVRFFIDDFGYHGVVKVDSLHPYFHVASYLRGKTLQTSEFLKQFFSLESLKEKSATPSLYRKRAPSKGRVFLCGDSLGYPEPFTGEGMRFAVETTTLFASLIDVGLSSWNTQIVALQEKQWKRCQYATWFIEKSFRRKVFFPFIPYLNSITRSVW
jgi:flavin-dependent dehydrogenase